MDMPHSRPMPNIGARCHELRIRDRDQIWRIIYRADVDAIVILEVFSKESRSTPKRVIERLPSKVAGVRSRRDPMKAAKKRKLEARGWTVGTAEEFLGLSKEESEFVQLKLALAEGVRNRRRLQNITQTQLAKLVGSSQSRIAKLEAADPTVAVDLMIRSLFATGAGRRELAGIIQRRRRSTAA